jgi:hypothetical protein
LRRWNTPFLPRRRTSRWRQTPTDAEACPQPDAAGSQGSAPGLLRALDEQEEHLLERLRAADGEPVSFAELRAEGIQAPGQVCYDLEIAGVPIVHVDRREHGRVQRVGILLAEPGDVAAPARVDSKSEATPHAVAAATPPAVSAPRIAPVARLRALLPAVHMRVPIPARTIGRRTAPVAPVVTLIAVLVSALVLTDPGGSPTSPASGGGPARSPSGDVAAGPQHAPRPSSHPQHPVAGLLRRAGAPRTRSIPVSPTEAAQIQLAGHQLLDQNEFVGAIRAMRTAIAASGQSLSGCRVPATQACLTYAYALYDLGRALRLSGHPAAAVSVLETRLQIADQRTLVAYELELARAQLRQRRS